MFIVASHGTMVAYRGNNLDTISYIKGVIMKISNRKRLALKRTNHQLGGEMHRWSSNTDRKTEAAVSNNQNRIYKIRGTNLDAYIAKRFKHKGMNFKMKQ